MFIIAQRFVKSDLQPFSRKRYFIAWFSWFDSEFDLLFCLLF